MILDRIQHYLSIVFFTTLVITQALVFVAVKASDEASLQAIFIEPISQQIDIGDSIYFQAMLSTQDDSQFDFVYFNLKNLDTGLDESYQASLQDDGTWIAQSAWDTSYNYQPGQYYLSAVVYDYENNLPVNIYNSDYQLINLVGEIVIAAFDGESFFFNSPRNEDLLEPSSNNPNLNIEFYVQSFFNDDVQHIRFAIFKLFEGNVPDDTYVDIINLDSSSGQNSDYVFWTDDTTSLLTFEIGNYVIYAYLYSDSGEGLVLFDLGGVVIEPVHFSVIDSTLVEESPTSVEILAPLAGEIITGDDLIISVTPNVALLAGQSIIAKFTSQDDTNTLDKNYNLNFFSSNPLLYEKIVNFDESFLDGNYNISFQLVVPDISINVVLGQVEIVLDREEEEIPPPEPEIIINHPVAGQTIVGDNIDLDFTTNWSASNFEFSLFKQGESTLGIDQTIPLVGDGTSWSTSVSAQDYDLTNGTYILSATADDPEGNEVDIGLIAFYWQITEDDPAPPEEASLSVYQPPSGQVGPSSILIASANVFSDIAFVLMSSGGGYIYEYTPEHSSVNCNTLSQEIREQATEAGHNYCFSAILGDDIVNGNYRYFIQYTINGAIEEVSNEVLVTYFNEANQEDDDEADDDEVVDDDTSDDGNTGDDGTDDDGSDDGDTGDDGTEEGGFNYGSNNESENLTTDNNIAIGPYNTCFEEGIEDEEACDWFNATVAMLDENCIAQGIYQALACEDYLYRVATDLECQENDIIDKEECKDYLLEKYSSQVDCQLDDISECNSVLRDEYLNRLVSGQKLSQSINEVIDPLLGTNISTQILSDSLEERGINSQKVLPLLASQDIKVLLARAQPEIVLEKKDQLTILNQAVLILDTDGDGLPDDLEEYYGTDINNSDTDGDGYSDGVEISNGYNPAGAGQLIKERTNLDKVILDEENIIEQPKIKSRKIDKRLEISSVDAIDSDIKLFGKAAVNTWVTLYLYSGLPLVMTTKTDASGNWSYDIKNSLTDGHHQVFVTINDDTGKIVKQSRPISFLIKEAKAVTADNYFDDTSSATAINNLFIYYILGGAFLVFLALGAIIFLHRGKNKNLEV